MRIPSSAIIPLIVFIISLVISPNNNKNNQKNQKKEKSNKNKQKFDNSNKNFANKNSNNSNNTSKTGGQSQFKSNQKSNAKPQTKTSYSNDTEMDEYYIKRERNRHHDQKNNPIYDSYDEDKELFDLKNAIIYSEILQKPLALRK